jgi:hypothetical protein
MEKVPAGRSHQFLNWGLWGKIINFGEFRVDRSRGLGSGGIQSLGVSVGKRVVLNTALSATALARDVIFSLRLFMWLRWLHVFFQTQNIVTTAVEWSEMNEVRQRNNNRKPMPAYRNGDFSLIYR